MKKLIAILLALILVFALCACGGQSDTGSGEKEPSSSVNNRVEEEEEEESEAETSSLVLSGEDNWVVVCDKGKGESLKINSLEELKDKKVSFAYETEAEQIATYYGAELHGAGGTQDALTLMGTVTDYAIVPDYAAINYDIVLEVKIP